MDENYKVYVHIFPNDKLYIGQTKQVPKLRYGKNGNGYKKCEVIWNAIQKYGWDNIKHVILFEGLSHEVANIIETELIKKYHTNDNRYGYNVADGGHRKHKSLKIYKYSLNGNYITSYDNISCLSEIEGYSYGGVSYAILREDDLKQDFSYKSYYNYLWSYCKVDKVPPYKNNTERTVYCYDMNTGEYIRSFKSLSCAARELNLQIPNIRISCNRDNCTAGGYIWRYEKLKTVTPSFDNHYHRTVEIYQYDKYGKFLNKYDTLKEAGEISGVDIKRIILSCNGKAAVTNGYIWMYYRNDDLAKEKSEIYFKKHKIIYQFDLDGNFIDKYENINEIVKKYEKKFYISKQVIWKCVKDESKIAYGYIWSYNENFSLNKIKKEGN